MTHTIQIASLGDGFEAGGGAHVLLKIRVRHLFGFHFGGFFGGFGLFLVHLVRFERRMHALATACA